MCVSRSAFFLFFSLLIPYHQDFEQADGDPFDAENHYPASMPGLSVLQGPASALLTNWKRDTTEHCSLKSHGN